jgi:hypothetical protein
MKAGIGIVFLLALVSCYRQAAPPETPPTASETVLIIEGYRDGDERRALQDLFKAAGLEVEAVNSGAGRAEYHASTTPENPLWFEELEKQLPAGWQIRREQNRLYLIRTP